MALYNQIRSKTYPEVKGQDKAVAILKSVLKENRLPNALLFTGTRGTGKTSIARIFARHVNCDNPTEDGPCNNCPSCREILSGNSMDVLELDAASNNSVEDVHALIKAAQYIPVRKKKVFILDEFHMLSSAAFNAMLKTIEEPNDNTIFIFCTTEEHKIPATIKSRCMKIALERISEKVIYEYLKQVCELPEYHIPYDEDALKLIAREADGSMRDALSILDPFLNRGKIDSEEVGAYLGVAWEENIFSVLSGIAGKDMKLALSAFHDVVRQGDNIKCFLKSLIQACIDLIYAQDEKRIEEMVCTKLYKGYLANMAGTFTADRLLHMIDELSKIYGNAKYTSVEFAAETTIISLMASETAIGKLETEIKLLKEEVNALKEQGVRVVSETVSPKEEIKEPETEQSLPEAEKQDEWADEAFQMYADENPEGNIWEIAGAEALGYAFPNVNEQTISEKSANYENESPSQKTEEVPFEEQPDLMEMKGEETTEPSPVPAECLPAGAVIGNDILLNVETKETQELETKNESIQEQEGEEADEEDDLFFDFFKKASLARH